MFGYFIGNKIAEMNVVTDIPTDDSTRNRVLLELKRDITIWSSPKVLNAFTRYWNFVSTPGGNLKKNSALMTDCIKAMRADIGLSNFGLSSHFVTELIIQDPREIAKFMAGAQE